MQLASQLIGGLKGRVMVNAGAKPYLSVKMKEDEPVALMRKVLSVWSEAQEKEEKK